MTSLRAVEVVEWNELNSNKWRTLFDQHPEAMALPCDIRETATVGGLLQHIVAAELRYAERLGDEAVTDYADIPNGTAEGMFAVHDRAMAKFHKLLADDAFDWEQEIEFPTRSLAGRLIASRRDVLFHALFHSMRHYAQLATLLRHAGIKTDWPMDFLFLHARVVASVA